MLATDLLLLALDDERGTVLPQAALGLPYGLAGGVLMELGLRGLLRMDGEKLSAVGTTGDAILDDALRDIEARPGKTVAHWIARLSGGSPGLRQRLLDRLVAQGTLEKREQRILLLFHHTVYPERDGRVEHDVRARLDDALLHGARPDAPIAALIHLATACQLLDALYPKAQHAAIKARVAQLDDPQRLAADSVANAVQQAQAAAVMVAMSGAIVASTIAATSAACAATSASCH